MSSQAGRSSLCRSVQERYISISQNANLQLRLPLYGQPALWEPRTRAANVSDEHTGACWRCWHMMLLWSCTTDTNFCRDHVPAFVQRDLVKVQDFGFGKTTRSVMWQITWGRLGNALRPWTIVLLPDATVLRLTGLCISVPKTPWHVLPRTHGHVLPQPWS